MAFVDNLKTKLGEELDKLTLPQPTDDLIDEAKRREEAALLELEEKFHRFHGLEGFTQQKESVHVSHCVVFTICFTGKF